MSILVEELSSNDPLPRAQSLLEALCFKVLLEPPGILANLERVAAAGSERAHQMLREAMAAQPRPDRR